MSRTEACRSCGASIIWGQTAQGRPCPLDKGTLTSHYRTCTTPDRWSKAKQPEPELPGQLSLFPKEDQ